MTRWQYKVVNLGMFFAGDRLVQTLGRLGADGWELITIYDKSSNWLANMEKGFALFKRPVAAGDSPDGPWASAMFAGASGTGVTPTSVQELMTRAGIKAPGAPEAIAPQLDSLDGLARCTVDGAEGVFALGGNTGVVWQPEAGVQPFATRDLVGHRRSEDSIVLIAAGGAEVVLYPRAKVLDAFVKLLEDRDVQEAP